MQQGFMNGVDPGLAGSQTCCKRENDETPSFQRNAALAPYHFGMRTMLPPMLPINTTLLKPGLRLAVGVSGGADSVALLRALADRSGPLGLVLHVAHLHHGLRGAEADGDLDFARALAAELGLPFHEARVDTAAEARANAESGKSVETIEEAARRLRYGWFRQLMASGEVDAVATAHTRDDQAETVLAKFLRGAWTEGLSGIHPSVEFAEGRILRPLLGATRAEVEAYLNGLGQGWREDSSNRHLTFTRNRIRHELLPLLEGWNPRLREHLAQMAALARDEEAWWQAELARLAPQLLLPGRAGSGVAAAAASLCGGTVGRGAGFCLDRGAAYAGAQRPRRAEARIGARAARRADGQGTAAGGGGGFGCGNGWSRGRSRIHERDSRRDRGSGLRASAADRGFRPCSSG
jgi:tRNA(Ile)-lysidine synthase